MKGLVGRNNVLDAGNDRPVIWPASGSDQDVFRFDRFAVREADRVRIFEGSARLDDLRAGFFHVAGVDAFEPSDLLVLVRDECRPVERHLGNGPSKAGGVVYLMTDMR